MEVSIWGPQKAVRLFGAKDSGAYLERRRRMEVFSLFIAGISIICFLLVVRELQKRNRR
jgi:hypothetical protein